jgi:LysM repeat protein
MLDVIQLGKKGRNVQMGKFLYDPEVKGQEKFVESDDMLTETYAQLIQNIDSVRPVGDTDCEFVFYLEDYAYTYLYQFASTDLTLEHSGVLIGEMYPESKEAIVCGIIPIDRYGLTENEEWINVETVKKAEEIKEAYFPGMHILGWFHMQPGYGTMLTMKEVKVHRDLFEKEGTSLLLIDPINKIETFYVYEDATLKEQTGYYVYYDKNPYMQKYMVENPFISQERQETEDAIVTQFRELGKKRKIAYTKRRQTNGMVLVMCIALVALAAVLTRVNDQNEKVQELQTKLSQLAQNIQNETTSDENDVTKFIIQPTDTVANTPENIIEEIQPVANTNTEDTDVVEKEIVENSEISDVALNGQATQEDEVKEVSVAATEEVIDYIIYEVETGDTLRSISMKHYQTESRAKEIIKLNDLDNGDHIFVGQKLKLMPQ